MPLQAEKKAQPQLIESLGKIEDRYQFQDVLRMRAAVAEKVLAEAAVPHHYSYAGRFCGVPSPLSSEERSDEDGDGDGSGTEVKWFASDGRTLIRLNNLLITLLPSVVPGDLRQMSMHGQPLDSILRPIYPEPMFPSQPSPSYFHRSERFRIPGTPLGAYTASLGATESMTFNTTLRINLERWNIKTKATYICIDHAAVLRQTSLFVVAK